MKQLIGISLYLAIGLMASAHPWKPNHYIIIDTDGGLDDFRAICLFLAAPDVRVLAITCSDGVLDADSAYNKVKSLLAELHHEGLPVGVFFSESTAGKNCSPAVEFDWGMHFTGSVIRPAAAQVLDAVTGNTRERISMICMGSLAAAASYISSREQQDGRISQILWSSRSSLDKDNFNFILSPESYSLLRDQPGIMLNHIDPSGLGSFYSADFLDELQLSGNQLARKIGESLIGEDTPYRKAFFDEILAVYLRDPSLFIADTLGGVIHSRVKEAGKVYGAYREILDGSYVNQNQVLQYFPLEKRQYQDDVGRIMERALVSYGTEEWMAGVLANEMHRHLGVYAIVGVKMGIRARDFLMAGVDEMQVESFAGSDPPFSCMNDGLQISTGATLGHGLIKVNAETEKLPQASFTYLGRTISIALKNEYRQRIESQVRELSVIYGLNSNIYWELLREAAINYWADWDRNEIFEITEISQPDQR